MSLKHPRNDFYWHCYVQYQSVGLLASPAMCLCLSVHLNHWISEERYKGALSIKVSKDGHTGPLNTQEQTSSLSVSL